MRDNESPPMTHSTDLPTEDFERAAARVVEWIARYLESPERYPVLSRVAPGEVRASLPQSPPECGEPLDAILDDFESKILPGVTHWNHPGFFAYFSISSSVPGIIGEMLTAALDVNGMLWRTSPSATELESLVLDWLRQLLGLGEGWFGMITDTASISTMLALAAAREARPELAIRERGMAGRSDLPVMRVYCSTETHSSVAKGAITLGLGHENVVLIPTDDEFRMRADLLERAIRDDRAAGRLPLAAVATVGTTSTTSVDPVRAIAGICRREEVWLHVDGAYGGVAAVVPELRHVLDGVELADSLVVNPHKWLFTPVDCSAFYTRRPEVLKEAFSLVPEYLRTDDAETAKSAGLEMAGASHLTSHALPVNYMDYGVQLGRRFRALKLWMVIRAFGAEGLAERIRGHVALAQELARWVEAEPGWEVSAPHPFSLVCFRHAPNGVSDEEADAMNERIMARVNESGRVFLSHTKLRGRYVLRLAIGNIRTERRHLEEAWRLLREAAEASRHDR
jgi:aromatic-L-amino-acid decarboxylase